MKKPQMGTMFVAVCVFMSSMAWAQTDTARIVGTVSDTSGAVIAGVTVTITSEKTGAQRSAISNEKGFFVATPLPPSTYTVKTDQPGFAGGEFSGVIVQIGEEKTVNIVLKPAGVATEVTVSGGELTAIDTSSARVGVNVSEREVAQLPINGREISQLYLLAPGAVNFAGGTFDDIRFNGRSFEQNVIRLDGIEAGGIISNNPSN